MDTLERVEVALSHLLLYDIIDTKDMALFLHKVRDNMIKIPKATYREKEKRWMMMVPASASASGKRYPVYGATEQEVLRNYILQVEFKKGEKVPILEEYLFSYLKTFVLGVKEDTTYDRYYGCCKNQIQGTELGKMRLNVITEEDVLEFFKEKIRKGLSKSYIKTIHTILNQAFIRAKKKKFMEDNPLEGMDIPYKRCKKQDPEKEILSYEDLKKLEAGIKNAWNTKKRYIYSPIFLVMAYTGLRIGEAMALTWSDIDFTNHVIHVNKQMAEGYKYDANGKREGKIYYKKLPKTETSIRDVPMADHTEECLLELKRRYIQANRMCELVVCNKKQKIPTKSNMYDLWDKLLDYSDIEYAKVHKLRKTFATVTITEGVAISDVSEVLGHRDTGITMAAYYKATGNSKESVRNTLKNVYDTKIS